MVVAQLAEHLLLTPEIHGSNQLSYNTIDLLFAYISFKAWGLALSILGKIFVYYR